MLLLEASTAGTYTVEELNEFQAAEDDAYAAYVEAMAIAGSTFEAHQTLAEAQAALDAAVEAAQAVWNAAVEHLNELKG